MLRTYSRLTSPPPSRLQNQPPQSVCHCKRLSRHLLPLFLLTDWARIGQGNTANSCMCQWKGSCQWSFPRQALALLSSQHPWYDVQRLRTLTKACKTPTAMPHDGRQHIPPLMHLSHTALVYNAAPCLPSVHNRLDLMRLLAYAGPGVTKYLHPFGHPVSQSPAKCRVSPLLDAIGFHTSQLSMHCATHSFDLSVAASKTRRLAT